MSLDYLKTIHYGFKYLVILEKQSVLTEYSDNYSPQKKQTKTDFFKVF